MKVKDLIKELERFDKELPVCADGREITSVDVTSVYSKSGVLKIKNAVNILLMEA